MYALGKYNAMFFLFIRDKTYKNCYFTSYLRNEA